MSWRQRRGLLLLCLMILLPRPAAAEWPTDPRVNLALCTAPGDQTRPTVVSDGAGGAVVAWEDQRTGNWDIYAQHVLAAGTVDPRWPANGRALCTAINDQSRPEMVSDGAGGAIVSWQDARSGRTNIYAQHVLAGGAVDPAWPMDGLALGSSDDTQIEQVVVPDGAGGAIVSWLSSPTDNGSHAGGFPGGTTIVAQHVLIGGAVDSVWAARGRRLGSVRTLSRDYLTTTHRGVADGAGGAIFIWVDNQEPLETCGQHVLADGALDSAWADRARPLCMATERASDPVMLPDGRGGAILAWTGGGRAVAQHVLATGAVDPEWPPQGRGLALPGPTRTRDAPVQQLAGGIVADGAGGAIVAWECDRYDNPDDIYVQHVLAKGDVDSTWSSAGCRLHQSARFARNLGAIVADGHGGAVVTWTRILDFGGISLHGREFHSDDDIHAQHVLASGVPDPAWPANGSAVCTAKQGQLEPRIVADDAGGYIVVWQDRRNHGQDDIYAQRIQSNGWLGGAVSGPR